MTPCQDGVGVHHFWGFSPALDLQEVHDNALREFQKQVGDAAPTPEEEPPLSVLLVMPGDPRSIIKTICQRLRHKRRRIEVCSCARDVARIGLVRWPRRLQRNCFPCCPRPRPDLRVRPTR